MFTEHNEGDFKNLLFNFSDDDNSTGRYRRMDMVVDSRVFVSGVPPEYHPDYKLQQVSEGQADGGRTASGETIPILGVRRLRVSLVETIRDLTMNVKVIQGL